MQQGPGDSGDRRQVLGDPDLRRVLKQGLGDEGFTVRLANSGAEALALANAERPDLVVLDIGLPDSDGRDICQALRTSGIDSPVLFLTARDAPTDRLLGFGAGLTYAGQVIELP